MFVVVGILILIVSFVIAFVSLLRDQKAKPQQAEGEEEPKTTEQLDESLQSPKNHQEPEQNQELREPFPWEETNLETNASPGTREEAIASLARRIMEEKTKSEQEKVSIPKAVEKPDTSQDQYNTKDHFFDPQEQAYDDFSSSIPQPSFQAAPPLNEQNPPESKEEESDEFSKGVIDLQKLVQDKKS